MKGLFLAIVVLSSLCWGSDVFNVGLRVNLEYSDLNSHCRLSSLVEPFRLGAEVQNGRVTRAQITKKSRFLEPLVYELNEQELSGLDYREEDNLFWIKQLYVSPELLRKFLFAGKGFGSDSCIPPEALNAVPLPAVLFDFGVDSVGYLLPALISSQEVILRDKFEGTTPFRIRISLTQDRR